MYSQFILGIYYHFQMYTRYLSRDAIYMQVSTQYSRYFCIVDVCMSLVPTE